MNDLFSEIYEERSAIAEFDGLLTREEAERRGLLEAEAYRHACEVRTVAAMPLMERRAFLDDVENRRGAKAADKLRYGLTQLWLERKAA